MNTKQKSSPSRILGAIAMPVLMGMAMPVAGAPKRIVSYGNLSKSNHPITFNNASDVVLTPKGTVTLMGEEGIGFSCAPGNLLTKVKNGDPADGGLVLAEIDDSPTAVSQNGELVFYSTTRTTGGLSRPPGLFATSNGKVVQIAAQGAAAPGGGLFDFGPGGFSRNSTKFRISNNGRYVAFRSRLTGGPGDGIYFVDTSIIPLKARKVVAAGDPEPAGETYAGFNDVYRDFAVINNGKVVFRAPTTKDGQFFNPLYVWSDGSVSAIPGSDSITFFQVNDNENVLACTESELRFGSFSGVSKILGRFDPASGGGTFFSFEHPLLDSAGNVAFAASFTATTAGNGVFLRTVAGTVTKIMVTTDAVPGGGLFETPGYRGLYPVSIDGSTVFFRASTGSGAGGIFGGNGNQLTKIVRTGDVIDGSIVTNVTGYVFNERNTEGQFGFVKGGQFVYHVQSGAGGALFTYPYVAKPEIDLKSAGKSLVDGKTTKQLGNGKTGVVGKPFTFDVWNLGNANLKNLKVSIAGRHPSDFKLEPFKTTFLRPGAKTSFRVSFKPTRTGARSAIIRIASDDSNENPFDFIVTGNGTR